MTNHLKNIFTNDEETELLDVITSELLIENQVNLCSTSVVAALSTVIYLNAVKQL